ncbi:MAG: shikimate dehydrogenase [Proteobacteria bacterium]|nr:shikimate dehydrogenase [Pseudomonadota bacterium]
MKNNRYQLALFGQPVKHSQSPEIHTAFAKQFNLKIDYHLIESDALHLQIKVRDFFLDGGTGANVTIPHKSLIMDMLDEISVNAEAAGAINTIINKNGLLYGENTDGTGFVTDIQNHRHFSLSNKKILIIGAGGATKGILPAIIKHRPKYIHISNRTISKAEQLCHQHTGCDVISPEVLKSSKYSYDLIINSTSMGHEGQTPELFINTINADTIAYDLSYGKAAQVFIQQTQKMGIKKAYDGYGMLQAQAAHSFKLWFGKMPAFC